MYLSWEVLGDYYHEETGVAKSLAILKQQTDLNIGIVGLGAGVLAKFGDESDQLRFYELNPAVYKMAQTYFTYLNDSQAEIEVEIADGRIALTHEVQANAPLMNGIVIDAFSSDVIPAHLLTLEAFEIYWQRMSEDGVLIFHISNTHLDIMPMLQSISEHFDKALIRFKESGNASTFRSDWVALTSNQAFLDAIPADEVSPILKGAGRKAELWTDDKNSLLPLLRL